MSTQPFKIKPAPELNAIGVKRYKDKKYQDAIECFTAALRLHKNLDPEIKRTITFNLGRALLAKGDYQAANAKFVDVLGLDEQLKATTPPKILFKHRKFYAEALVASGEAERGLAIRLQLIKDMCSLLAERRRSNIRVSIYVPDIGQLRELLERLQAQQFSAPRSER